MKQSRWVRLPECFSLNELDGSVKVHHPAGSVLLTKEEAKAWGQLDVDELPPSRLAALAQSGVIYPRQQHAHSPSRWDALTPRIPCHGLRWYQESSDLVVLFNTGLMRGPNPLIVLGAQGSLIWQGVLEQQSIGQIRARVAATFDGDDVISLIARLMRLGFLESDPELAQVASSTASRLEIAAPRAQAALHHSTVPWYCLWETNTTCDLRCRICYLPNFTEPGVTRARACMIADEIIEAGALYVCLLGGEFLLREDAIELVHRLREADLYVKIITNGRSLTPELARALATAGLNQIEVSFDGVSQEQHERSRGRDTWRAARAAIAHARDAGIPRGGVVFTVHDENQEEVARLPEFLDDVGINECYVSLFKKTGRQGARAPWQPPDRQKVTAEISAIGERRPDLAISLLPSCSCGRTSVVVGHDESVRTCSFSYHSVGSLREQSLRDVWRSLNDRIPSGGPVGFCSAPAKLRVLS